MHTRFEHSLGVMHMATQLYDAIVGRSRGILNSEFGFTEEQLKRDRLIVRLAALLHDTGHAPFSHAGEGLFPIDPQSKIHHKHESYSMVVIRTILNDIIENHPQNRAFGLKAEEIAAFYEGKSTAGPRLLWRPLVDGQMDADRMDYLLRDSLHTGVDYGKYDCRRLLNTMQAIDLPDQGPRIGVSEGGVHAAEALVLARYYMFTQVYFHKTRVAYDIHIREALKELLPGGTFPLPSVETIRDYLRWDDWRVLGLLADGSSGGEHGDRLQRRDHDREVYHSPETPADGDRSTLNLIRKSLGELVVATESSKTSTYKLQVSDISVQSEDDLCRVRPLSYHSSVVRNLVLHPIEIVRLYSKPENAATARSKVAELLKEDR